MERVFAALIITIVSSFSFAVQRGTFEDLKASGKIRFAALTYWDTKSITVKKGKSSKRELRFKSKNKNNKFKSIQAEYKFHKSKFENQELSCDNLALIAFFYGDTKICNNKKKVSILNGFSLKNVEFYSKRVIEVSYLFASKGTSAMSRFGHSMFYIKVCTLDEDDCPIENQFEFVIGFSASVRDGKIKIKEGIMGDYPSVLRISSLHEVKQKYNFFENRSLEFYPIKLSPIQRTAFVEQAMKTYENYKGNYAFFTNNCATEAYSLIQSVVDSIGLKKTLYMPKSVVRELRNLKLTSKNPDRVIKGKRNKLDDAAKRIVGESIRFEDYSKLTSDERLEIYKGSLGKTNNYFSFLLLEKQVLKKRKKELVKQILKMDEDSFGLDAERLKKVFERELKKVDDLTELNSDNISSEEVEASFLSTLEEISNNYFQKENEEIRKNERNIMFAVKEKRRMK